MAGTYTFATPVLGGQASASLLAAYGSNSTSLAGSLVGTLTGPGGGTFPFSRFDSIDSSLSAFGDLIPQFALRWNAGVNHYMTYITADIPAGAYQSTCLANLGIGHWAVDAGGGYTYFDPKTGHEFSAVLGFTYNFVNPSTQYQSGVDMHFDLGRVAIPDQAVAGRPRRVRLSATRLRQRLRRSRRLLPVAGGRRRPAGRLHFPGRSHAGISEPESLRRIRQ